MNGEVVSMNGALFTDMEPMQANYNKPQALEQALDHIGAQVYKWQVPQEEAYLKLIKQNPYATYFPEGSLEYITL